MYGHVIDEFKFLAFTAKDNSDCTEQKVCFSTLPDGSVVSWGANTEINTGEQYESHLSRKLCYSIMISTNGPAVS